ncbi:hypothetical protein [Niallia sp. Man26]|uniref:hypothetical protein n=1 Tax=Niallia sp. Man26 TaxID=2912824 RepID=UPI001EDA75BD|nr:hypothetical protein [Niallia sp. Man26]UPO90545.1 hypothetical protein L8T27_021060 [Niallia sp. Man26]
MKYDFSQYEKKLVGNTWVLGKNGLTDQDAAKASLANNEAIKKGEVSLIQIFTSNKSKQPKKDIIFGLEKGYRS